MELTHHLYIGTSVWLMKSVRDKLQKHQSTDFEYLVNNQSIHNKQLWLENKTCWKIYMFSNKLNICCYTLTSVILIRYVTFHHWCISYVIFLIFFLGGGINFSSSSNLKILDDRITSVKQEILYWWRTLILGRTVYQFSCTGKNNASIASDLW